MRIIFKWRIKTMFKNSNNGNRSKKNGIDNIIVPKDNLLESR